MFQFIIEVCYDACPGSINLLRKLAMYVSHFDASLLSGTVFILPWFCPYTRQMFFSFPDRGVVQAITFCVIIIAKSQQNLQIGPLKYRRGVFNFFLEIVYYLQVL